MPERSGSKQPKQTWATRRKRDVASPRIGIGRRICIGGSPRLSRPLLAFCQAHCPSCGSRVRRNRRRSPGGTTDCTPPTPEVFYSSDTKPRFSRFGSHTSPDCWSVGWLFLFRSALFAQR